MNERLLTQLGCDDDNNDDDDDNDEKNQLSSSSSSSLIIWLLIDNNQIHTTRGLDKVNLFPERLQVLSLEENKLEKIPKELFQLKNLKTLCLQKNEICAIPVEVMLLSKIEYIYLQHNNITTDISYSLCELKSNLRLIQLDHNPLDGVDGALTAIINSGSSATQLLLNYCAAKQEESGTHLITHSRSIGTVGILNPNAPNANTPDHNDLDADDHHHSNNAVQKKRNIFLSSTKKRKAPQNCEPVASSSSSSSSSPLPSSNATASLNQIFRRKNSIDSVGGNQVKAFNGPKCIQSPSIRIADRPRNKRKINDDRSTTSTTTTPKRPHRRPPTTPHGRGDRRPIRPLPLTPSSSGASSSESLFSSQELDPNFSERYRPLSALVGRFSTCDQKPISLSDDSLK